MSGVCCLFLWPIIFIASSSPSKWTRRSPFHLSTLFNSIDSVILPPWSHDNFTILIVKEKHAVTFSMLNVAHRQNHARYNEVIKWNLEMFKFNCIPSYLSLPVYVFLFSPSRLASCVSIVIALQLHCNAKILFIPMQWRWQRQQYGCSVNDGSYKAFVLFFSFHSSFWCERTVHCFDTCCMCVHVDCFNVFAFVLTSCFPLISCIFPVQWFLLLLLLPLNFGFTEWMLPLSLDSIHFSLLLLLVRCCSAFVCMGINNGITFKYACGQRQWVSLTMTSYEHDNHQCARRLLILSLTVKLPIKCIAQKLPKNCTKWTAKNAINAQHNGMCRSMRTL